MAQHHYFLNVEHKDSDYFKFTDYFFDLAVICFLRNAKIANTINNTRLKITIVALTGISVHVKDVVSPATTEKTDTETATIITDKNRLHTRIEVSAGKIIIADIRSVPSIRIPITMVTAVSKEITVL